MYHHIRGKLVDKTPSYIVVEAGGVGYMLKIPFSTYETLPGAGEPDVMVYTHFSVSENNQALYGFATKTDRDVFKALIGVNGVGPAIAIAALSGASAVELLDAVLRGDVDFLKRIKGIGAKTAQRIILDMRGHLSEEILAEMSSLKPSRSGKTPALDSKTAASGDALPQNLRDAVDGIMGLFELKADKARGVVEKVAEKLGRDTNPATLIRAAIKRLR